MMRLSNAARSALEALAPDGRAAMGVSVYDFEISLTQRYWIHPATLAALERRGLVELDTKTSMIRRITDAGRAALAVADAGKE